MATHHRPTFRKRLVLIRLLVSCVIALVLVIVLFVNSIPNGRIYSISKKVESLTSTVDEETEYFRSALLALAHNIELITLAQEESQQKTPSSDLINELRSLRESQEKTWNILESVQNHMEQVQREKQILETDILQLKAKRAEYERQINDLIHLLKGSDADVKHVPQKIQISPRKRMFESGIDAEYPWEIGSQSNTSSLVPVKETSLEVQKVVEVKGNIISGDEIMKGGLFENRYQVPFWALEGNRFRSEPRTDLVESSCKASNGGQIFVQRILGIMSSSDKSCRDFEEEKEELRDLNKTEDLRSGDIKDFRSYETRIEETKEIGMLAEKEDEKKPLNLTKKAKKLQELLSKLKDS